MSMLWLISISSHVNIVVFLVLTSGLIDILNGSNKSGYEFLRESHSAQRKSGPVRLVQDLWCLLSNGSDFISPFVKL